MTNKIIKRSGFKNYNDTFWINEKGKYGCRYQCKFCGHIALGIGSRVRMHFSTCPEMKGSADAE